MVLILYFRLALPDDLRYKIVLHCGSAIIRRKEYNRPGSGLYSLIWFAYPSFRVSVVLNPCTVNGKLWKKGGAVKGDQLTVG